MCNSSCVGCARLSSCCSRGISFFGAAGSRKPIATSTCLPVLQRAVHGGGVGQRGIGRARRHRKPPIACRQS
jgi:hypothetical protein